VYRGDLLTDLPELAAKAPAGATLVIFHSTVLAYVEPGGRARFFATVAYGHGSWLEWLPATGEGILK